MREGTLRVAAVQMDVAWMDADRNVGRIVEFIEEASAYGAKLIVFPELASSGFVVGRDVDFIQQYRRAALSLHDAAVDELSAATRRHGCVAVVGLLREHPVVPANFCNSAVLFGPEGMIGVYDKTHIPSEEKHYFHPGSSLQVFNTPYAVLGCLICADSSFPEPARVLALQGAEVMCVSFNRPRLPPPAAATYLSVVVARAFENQVPVVAANRVGAQEWKGQRTEFEGGSCIVGSTGEVLAHAPHSEEDILVADLDFDEMADVRLWQTRYRDRRPELYRPLDDPLVPPSTSRSMNFDRNL